MPGGPTMKIMGLRGLWREVKGLKSLGLCIARAAPVHCAGPFSAIAVSSGSNADITLAAATRRLRQTTSS
jgi:hypothetical protein